MAREWWGAFGVCLEGPLFEVGVGLLDVWTRSREGLARFWEGRGVIGQDRGVCSAL